MKATTVQPTGPNSVVAVVPPGATTGPITVVNAAGPRTSTKVFTPLGAPTQIDAGAAHSCARLVGGTAACWGANASGQLGTGTLTAAASPMRVTGLNGVSSVATGGAFSCAVSNAGAAGTVKCWGANASGQLGRGNLLPSTTPVAVLAPGSATPLAGVSSVDAGAAFACAVSSPGASGTVRCWGANASGQLGDGTVTRRTRPVRVLVAPGVGLTGATSVSVGGSTACARLTTGAVRCWGSNTNGELGRGNLVNSRFAVRVTGIDGVVAKAKTVTVGAAHACAALTTGAVRCWGRNSSGQLGDGTVVQRTTPVAVKVSAVGALAGATVIAAGDVHTCAITGTGTAARIRCWGADSSGQLGNNAALANQRFAVLSAGTVTNGVTALAAGGRHTLVLAPNPAMPTRGLAAWGLNSSGQLGIGGTTTRPTPVRSVYL